MKFFKACIFLTQFIVINLYLSQVFSQSPFPLLLVISFDGFRYDYLDHVYTPNFHRLISDGVRAKWMNSLFVTKTFPNHFSIATGLFLETHGIVGNIMYDPVFKETFDMDNNESKWWDNGFSMPLWIANQIEDPTRFSGGYMWPGTDVSFYNTQAEYIVSLNESVPWEQRIDTVIDWFMNPQKPANCVFLYFEEPDLAGHFHGPLSKEVKREIIRSDNIMGYLIEKLQQFHIFERMNILIVSDHGMAEVPFENSIEMGIILKLEHVKIIGSTPIWHVIPKIESQRDYIYEILKNATLVGYQFDVYKKEEIPEEYHFKNHRRVMPILVIAKENYGLSSRKSPIPVRSFTRGQHGYNNSLLSMKPFFVAHGPAFKNNFYAEPFDNIDLYPLMCMILNVPIRCNNGSLENVVQMMNPYFFDQSKKDAEYGPWFTRNEN